MAETLTFTPDEFQIIETGIEFEESYHREESIGFFTLQEQLEDGFSKLLPSSGSISKYQIAETRKVVDGLRDLYSQFIIPVADGYKVQAPEFSREIPWLFPVYSPDDILSTPPSRYSVESQARLFENPRAPGFYTNFLLRTLPRPFGTSEKDKPYVVKTPTTFVNEKGKSPIRALPLFQVNRSVMRENGMVEIVNKPQDDTDDKITFSGYFLKKRPLDIPNPYEGHPFFQSNEDVFIPVTGLETQKDIFPEISTILEHGVPVTNDPYVEGSKYLKLYDVRLSEIPWSVWKTKFPPAPPLATTPPVEDLPFTIPSRDVPSKILLDTYGTTYSPGISSRFWLLNQLDGGEFVIKALLSKAGEQGTVGQIPGLGLPAYPPGKLEDCKLTDISYYKFLTTGILRRVWEKDKNPAYFCIPTDLILQERKQAGYNHIQWTEETAQKFLKEHLQALETHRRLEEFGKPVEYKPAAPSVESILHAEVNLVAEDTKRTDADKLKDITTLLKSTTVTNNRYLDSEGHFVICEHSLALLRGELEQDKELFLRTWTDSVSGFQVCRYCGEQILASDYVEQDEFDDRNNVIKRGEVIRETAKHLVFQKDILTLMTVLGYKETDASHSMLKTLITLFQVTPDPKYFIPLFQKIPDLQKRMVDKSGTISNIRGSAVGLAFFVLLLQAHVPTLYPKRVIGTTPLVLTGFPRDQPKDQKGGIVDGVLQCIQQAYTANPEGFRGKYEDIMIEVVNNYSKIRPVIIRVLEFCLENVEIRKMLEEARTKVVPVETTKVRIQLEPAERRQTNPVCSAITPVFMFETSPNVRQKDSPLPKLSQAETATILFRSVSRRQEIAEIPETVTNSRLNLKKDIPEKFKVPVSENYSANFALASFLIDEFKVDINIRSINLVQNPKNLVDISKGILYDIFSRIYKDTSSKVRLEELSRTSITYISLTTELKQSTETVVNLRAKQRQDFVSLMRQQSDEERDTIRRLLEIGQAPIIITNQDKRRYASELESFGITFTEAEEEDIEEEETKEEEDAIIPTPGDSEEKVNDGEGYYGTEEAKPDTDGRDYTQPTITDDADDGI